MLKVIYKGSSNQSTLERRVVSVIRRKGKTILCVCYTIPDVKIGLSFEEHVEYFFTKL